MAEKEYIERGALMKKIFPYGDIVDPQSYSINAKAIQKAMQDVPAADVVEINEDFEAMLVCAERYALGRQTYMPSLVVGYITPLLPRLNIRTLSVIEKDIAGAAGYGDEKIDKPNWMKFLVNVRAEIAERNGELYDL